MMTKQWRTWWRTRPAKVLQGSHVWLCVICRGAVVGSDVPVNNSEQWRRQRSKGARSFRGQKILQSGHPDALFFLKKLTTSKHRPPTPFHRQNETKAVGYGNICIFCSHCYRSKAIRRARQGGARAWARTVDLLAKSCDLARPGVAPPQILRSPPPPTLN